MNAVIAGSPFLVIPLGGLGVAGRLSFGPYGSYIDAQSWVAATATPTINGSPLTTGYGAPITTVGYDARTPGGAGAIKLVAPAGLKSSLAGNLPLYVKMTLTFGDRMAVCHRGKKTLNLPVKNNGALEAHLRHGDTIGPCP
jgi:hypothetical protein